MNKIRNIIFDLGGVLFDINYQHIIDEFHLLGIEGFEKKYTQLKQDHLFDQFETGAIGATEFRNAIRKSAGVHLNDEEIDDAWNSILIGFPERNIKLLDRLLPAYRLFLLSNTNEIHEKAFRAMLWEQHQTPVLEDRFEKIYLSHRIHLRKPDKEIFLRVLEDNKLIPGETLFIDDSPQHVEGALKTGLQAIWLKDGTWVGDVLRDY